MVDCPNGVLKVRYRYPGEEWTEIDGDDYTTENSFNLASARYFVFGTFYSKNFSAGGCNVTGYWRTASQTLSSQFNTFQPVKSGTSWILPLASGDSMPITNILNSQYNNNDISRYRYVITLQYLDRDAVCTNTTRPGYGCDVIYTKVIREDGKPATSNCVFKVYKSGVIVHEETRSVCPEAEVFCEETETCPPGTCECTNGNVTCCYNPRTGYCVKTIYL